MSMSKKDFELIADVISMGENVFKNENAKKRFIGGLSWYFGQTNPRFNEEKFRKRALEHVI